MENIQVETKRLMGMRKLATLEMSCTLRLVVHETAPEILPFPEAAHLQDIYAKREEINPLF
jgi:hypothetical protein